VACYGFQVLSFSLRRTSRCNAATRLTVDDSTALLGGPFHSATAFKVRDRRRRSLLLSRAKGSTLTCRVRLELGPPAGPLLNFSPLQLPDAAHPNGEDS